nr:putative zinc finger, CCHC-type [Tanacetum cinerariifolium]
INAGGSGSVSTGGSVDVQGCSYKTFMNRKPHSFNETEGVVGLKRWFEKMEQVFEICKCTEDDKVKFAMCTLEGRALTAYAAAPAEGRGYAGNLPRCNRCNSHHNVQCPPKCRKCQRTGHQEKDFRVRPLQD